MSIPDLVHCPKCGGDDHTVLDITERVGFWIAWFRCRACAWTFSVEG